MQYIPFLWAKGPWHVQRQAHHLSAPVASHVRAAQVVGKQVEHKIISIVLDENGKYLR